MSSRVVTSLISGLQSVALKVWAVLNADVVEAIKKFFLKLKEGFAQETKQASTSTSAKRSKKTKK